MCVCVCVCVWEREREREREREKESHLINIQGNSRGVVVNIVDQDILVSKFRIPFVRLRSLSNSYSWEMYETFYTPPTTVVMGYIVPWPFFKTKKQNHSIFFLKQKSYFFRIFFQNCKPYII